MIHIYGRAYPDVRPGYGQSYGLPDIPPNTDACVTAMATSGDTVVIGGSIYTSPYATHRLYRLSSSSHRSSGVIETVTIAADDPFSRKTVERLRIAHVLPVGTSLSVSFAVDGGIYETIRTIGSDAGTVSIIDPSEFPVGREFSTARLRVELLSESTSATPILRGVSLSYLSHDV
ncbi:MAG TPA: hypothetical protein PK765_04835 [bacterium]|nr:hypothetical protein [bacterium]